MEKLKFDWDQWNLQKNEVKHGVSALEAESALYDVQYQLFEDFKHSSAREKRFILYGNSIKNRILMIGFTIRRKKIRIIAARQASRKERKVYENEKT